MMAAPPPVLGHALAQVQEAIRILDSSNVTSVTIRVRAPNGLKITVEKESSYARKTLET